MSDTTARDQAGETELVGKVGDEIWVNIGPYLTESSVVHSAIEDTAQHVIRAVRAHDARRPAADAVERVKRGVFAALGTVKDEDSGEPVTYEQFMRDGHSTLSDEDTYTLTHASLDTFARAAIAAMPGDPLKASGEGLG